jgi:hypothetical protein
MSFYTKLLNYLSPSQESPKYIYDQGEYEVVIAKNEVGEKLILHIQKPYKGVVRV